MSGQFSDTVTALLSGKTIRAATLFFLDFENGAKRLWCGPHDLKAGGHVWQAMGKMISADGIAGAIGTQSAPMTFKLSGVDPTITAIAAQETDHVIGRDCAAYVQVFDEKWRPLDAPVAIGFGQADAISFDGQGPSQRTITLTIESFFATRSRPISSYYTDRDQQDRYPGDRGGEFIASMANKSINWPL